MAKGFRRLKVVGCLVWLSACGYASPGEGTRSLEVQGELVCDHQTLNTQVRFLLAKEGIAASNVNISLVDADTHKTISVPESTVGGTYTTEWPGYHRRIQAHLWREADGMTFRLETPGRHTIVYPEAGVVLAAGEPLKVRWRSDDGVQADYVVTSLVASETSHAINGDRGKDKFSSDVLLHASERLMVTRGNRISPAGATPHSLVTTSYSVDAPVIKRLGS